MRLSLLIPFLLLASCQILGQSPASPAYLTQSAADLQELRDLADEARALAEDGVTAAEAVRFGEIGGRAIEIIDGLEERTEAEAARLQAEDYAVLAQAVAYWASTLQQPAPPAGDLE